MSVSIPKQVTTLEWIGGVDGYLRLLDQTRLPAEIAYVDCRDADTVLTRPLLQGARLTAWELMQRGIEVTGARG